MSDQLEPGVGSADGASDADLVLRSRSGDADAFGELWSRHYRSGIAAARGITSTIDPDDLVQEAYTKIFQTVKRGGGPTGSFRAYLFTAIRNTAASWGRVEREVAIEAAEQVEDPDSSEEAAEAALDRGITHTAFRSLPTRWQEVLWYTEIEQMKPREVAPLLDLKPAAVSQLAARAREGLREAWIQAHLANVADGSEHQWAIEHLGAHTRGNLASRDRKRLGAHLLECARCTIVAEEAQHIGSRLAMVLLPLAIGIPAAGAYLATLQRGEHAAIALMAMPAEVVEGGIAVGGAAIGGGAAIASSGSGSGGSSAAAGTAATLTLGGLITAGIATAAIAIAVATGIPAHDSDASSEAAAFGSGAPGAASIEASDGLADEAERSVSATTSPTPAPSPTPKKKGANELGITGASVVDAASGSVAVDIVGTPGAVASVHAPGAADPVGAGGSADRPATAAIAAIDGAMLDQTTIGDAGSARLAFALTPAQVRADVTLTVLYADSAEPPARATLSALGIREPLLAALEPATPSPQPSIEPSPEAPQPDATPMPLPEEPSKPTPTAEPSEPAEPTTPAEPTVPAEPTPAPTAEPTREPTPEPTSTPGPTPTPEPTATPTAKPTPAPTATPEPSPTPTATPEPSPMPTPTATPTPTVTPTATPTPTPSEPPMPSPLPSERPPAALTAPTIKPISANGTKITIAWSDVDDAEQYAVYVNDTASMDDASQVEGSPVDHATRNITIAAPRSPGTYYYFVEATAEGFESATSAAAEKAVGDVYAPSTPAHLTATEDGHLTWDASTDNVGVHHYVVLRDGEPIDEQVTGTSYVDDDDLHPGTYTYTVRAVDEAGNTSDESDPQPRPVRDTEAPSTPAHLTVDADGLLTWDASTDNVGVDHYVVTRDPGALTVAVDGTSYADDADLPPGEYTYTVTAVDTAGNESHAGSASRVIEDVSAPTAPLDVAVTIDGKVSWTASVDDSGYVEYNVYRASALPDAVPADWGQPLNSTPLTTTSFTDEDPLDAGSYLYHVVAVDRAGNRADGIPTLVGGYAATYRPVVTITTGSYWVPGGLAAHLVFSGPANFAIENVGVRFYTETGPASIPVGNVFFGPDGVSQFIAADEVTIVSGWDVVAPAPLSSGNRVDVEIDHLVSSTTSLG